MELYKWQKEAIDRWNGSGTIKAVTGAGKSLVGKMIAEKVGGNILILAHRHSILDQWKVIMYGMENVSYLTFNVACKSNIKDIDLLIVDEAHRSTSPKFIELYDKIEYKAILGLTATPNQLSLQKCGPTICEVGYDEANISPFIVNYHGIDLTATEWQEYIQLTHSISGIIKNDEEDEKKKVLEALIMKRRALVYNAKRRLPLALTLIKEAWAEKRKTLVICQRIDQANEIDRELYMKRVVYHSQRQDDLNLYKEGKADVCISVGMLKEGFDDPGTTNLVIVSTTLSEEFNIQAIGRAIRYKPGKFATIHIIIANRTTDIKALRFAGNYDFRLYDITQPVKSQYAEDYYNGKVYGFGHHGLFRKKDKYGTREYYEDHPILNELRRLKHEGGRFVVSENGVFTKVGFDIIKVSGEVPQFIEKKSRSYSDKPMTFEELFGGEKDGA